MLSQKNYANPGNPEALILLLKTMKFHSLCYRWTPSLLGGAPFSATCACVTIKRRCVLFIYTAKYTLQLETFLFRNFLMQKQVQIPLSLSLVLQYKYTLLRYLY